MAKRFTDSEKWKKPWFRKLTPDQKCFWIYLLDQCDQAGFWAVDFDLAQIFIGADLNESELRTVFKKQYVELDGGKKWFIQDFIDFQYGVLKETNRLHAFVMKIIEKQGVSIPLKQVLDGAKDKDKVKVKEIKGIVKGENPEKQTDELPPREKWFDELWQKYPVKDGKKHAKRHFLASVKTAEDYARISKALDVYLQSRRVKDGFIKNASTWFNGWEDWENYQEPTKQETDAEKAERIIAEMKRGAYAKSV